MMIEAQSCSVEIAERKDIRLFVGVNQERFHRRGGICAGSALWARGRGLR